MQLQRVLLVLGAVHAAGGGGVLRALDAVSLAEVLAPIIRTDVAADGLLGRGRRCERHEGERQKG